MFGGWRLSNVIGRSIKATPECLKAGLFENGKLPATSSQHEVLGEINGSLAQDGDYESIRFSSDYGGGRRDERVSSMAIL
jgi:hypothetical protein